VPLLPQRLMELEVGSLTSADYGEKSRVTHRGPGACQALILFRLDYVSEALLSGDR
jgi:hypothetical protein